MRIKDNYNKKFSVRCFYFLPYVKFYKGFGVNQLEFGWLTKCIKFTLKENESEIHFTSSEWESRVKQRNGIISQAV